MRVSKEEMAKSHQRIVEGAARLFRERGIEGASVSDVMTQAGLTQGGFYRHFETKEALVDASLQAAFDQSTAYLEAFLEKHPPSAALTSHRAHYLSDGHVTHAGIGCPVVALGSEISRGMGQLKKSFGAGVQRMITLLAKAVPGSPKDKRANAAREFAMLVGAVVIARASDPETAQEVLAACRATPPA